MSVCNASYKTYFYFSFIFYHRWNIRPKKRSDAYFLIEKAITLNCLTIRKSRVWSPWLESVETTMYFSYYYFIVTETSENVTLACVAGSVFDRDCNVCRCTSDGLHALCTHKACAAPPPQAEITPGESHGLLTHRIPIA